MAAPLARKLRRLWRMVNGRCQSCGIPTKTMSDCKYRGWQVEYIGKHAHRIIDHNGLKYRIATIEHLIPRRNGGTNEFKNLTLYCKECNLKSDQDMKRAVQKHGG